MEFGRIAVAEALGAILAHGLRLPDRNLKKGRVLDRADLAILQAAGVEQVIAARLGEDDVHEDAAAARLAQALAGPGLRVGAPFTGRCNLFAEGGGLLVVDEARIRAANLAHEALTVATLPAWTLATPRQMVATVKIIPFAAPADALAEAEQRLRAGETAAMRVAPLAARDLGLVQTRLPATRESVLDKTRRVMEQRLAALGSRLVAERRCVHEEQAVADAVSALLAEGVSMVLVAGASAIVDRRDVVPAGIERAGGHIQHFGMPVDPGNLLLLARLGETPVLGLPGCARSPKFNGLDQVLQRLLADLPVTPADVMGMGVGGLLKEFAGRPVPRAGAAGGGETAARAPHVSAVLLAAGQSRRMPGANKLLVEVADRPMVCHVLDALLASGVDDIVVVTGHETDSVRAALLADRDETARARLRFVLNEAHDSGMGSSLAAGIGALGETVDAALVCLGDMPHVDSQTIERLLAAFDPLEGRAVCVPVHAGKRGNPVLWAREFFAQMRRIEGDVGARALLGEHAERVCEVPVPQAGVLLDVDSAEALAELQAGGRT